MTKLFESINKLKSKYDSKREKDRFNIISIFHHEREERLHSRVISYLLSSSSGHGMKDVYGRLFIQNVLKLSDNEFDLTNFKVIPNEQEKSEYKFIDILIINKKSQAIIIENKIDAKDSNHTHKLNLCDLNEIQSSSYYPYKIHKEGYIGQLERYFNTIKTGKDKDGVHSTNQCNNVFVYYLSPNGKLPDSESIGMLKDIPESWNEKSIISYDYHIREWLKECIEKTPLEKAFVKEFIQHYLKTVNKMTFNDSSREERIELKNTIGKNLKDSKYLIDNFKHVKWHTVYDFWKEMIDKLTIDYKNIEVYYDDESYKEIDDTPFIKAITEVTHLNKANLNYGILFDLKNGDRAYISGKYGLSWGNQSISKWKSFDNNIDFSNFSQDNTYKLIDTVYMKKIIESIINEILNSEKNNFSDLKRIDL